MCVCVCARACVWGEGRKERERALVHLLQAVRFPVVATFSGEAFKLLTMISATSQDHTHSHGTSIIHCDSFHSDNALLFYTVPGLSRSLPLINPLIPATEEGLQSEPVGTARSVECYPCRDPIPHLLHDHKTLIQEAAEWDYWNWTSCYHRQQHVHLLLASFRS